MGPRRLARGFGEAVAPLLEPLQAEVHTNAPIYNLAERLGDDWLDLRVSPLSYSIKA